ncbi:MAG: DUF6702 family protein [Bacteroidota bacterium]
MTTILLHIFHLLLFPNHNMPVAIYSLKIQEDRIHMEVKFDKENIRAAIQNQYSAAVSPKLIVDYFITHSKWVVNEHELLIQGTSVQSDHEYYHLSLTLPFENKELLKLELHNTCLIAEVEDQSNIIMITYEGKERAFRLTKSRPTAKIDW